MKKLLFICSIIIATHANAMKRLRRGNNNRPHKKICTKTIEQKNIFLPYDMRLAIFDECIHNNGKLTDIIATTKSLVMTEKLLYERYNNQQFIDNWIELLSKKFQCSHQIIAQQLHSQWANKRLTLQNALESLCLHNVDFFYGRKNRFDTLIDRGALLNFTYSDNKNNQPKTLLMITYEKYNAAGFSLLKEMSDFNQETSQNKTFLMMVSQFPIRYIRAEAIIKEARVDINQQNSKGETALLRCIKNRKKYYLSTVFIETIKAFLKKGADPKLADKRGKTPLSAAHKIPNTSEKKEMLIKLIEKAIGQ